MSTQKKLIVSEKMNLVAEKLAIDGISLVSSKSKQKTWRRRKKYERQL